MADKWVLNTEIVVPVNLRYDDANGDPVTKLFPLEYLTLVGQTTNTIITNYNTLSAVVANQSVLIEDLQQITSGITSPYVTPEVDGQCFNGNTFEAIDTLLEKQITASCIYFNLLGTVDGLNQGIGSECVNLNSDTSFATGGSMSGISGWINSPVTLADSFTNLWLTMCDARAGIKTLFQAVRSNCSQITINFAVQIPNFSTGINIYFAGYTFIPDGYIDNGSTIKITDSMGNIYYSPIDIVALSLTTSPYNVLFSDTILIPTSNYIVEISSNLENAALNLTCQKSTFQTVINTIDTCPVVVTSAGATSVTYTLYPYITSDVTYTVDLLNVSGTTIQTDTYTNPSGLQVGSFTGLNTSSNYSIRITTTVTQTSPVTCPLIPVSTTS